MTDLERAKKAERMRLNGDDPHTIARLCGYRNVPALLRALSLLHEEPKDLIVKKPAPRVDVLEEDRERIKTAAKADRLDAARCRIDWRAVDSRRKAKTVCECAHFRALRATTTDCYLITMKGVGERVLTVHPRQIAGLIELVTQLGVQLYDGEASRIGNGGYFIRGVRAGQYEIRQNGHRKSIDVKAAQVPDLLALLTDLGVRVCAGNAERSRAF